MNGHVDLTPFRTIISDWFKEREVAEKGDWWDNLDEVDKAGARHFDFMGKIKYVTWALKQQGRDPDVLSNTLAAWFVMDYLQVQRGLYSQPISPLEQEFREEKLFFAITSYFEGQGFKTKS